MAKIIKLESRSKRDKLGSRRIFPNSINITSGKGGTGKSVLASNLGYIYSSQGIKCLVWDGNHSLGNIDVLYGIAPKYNISHVMTGKNRACFQRHF